jgi:hypothetical protein
LKKNNFDLIFGFVRVKKSELQIIDDFMKKAGIVAPNGVIAFSSMKPV